MNHIDKIDMSILDNLQKNGRMTNVELANRAGISAPPCLRRLKNLEDSGVIISYHANINNNVVGYKFSAFCFVSISKQSAKYAEEFVEYVAKLNNVRECVSTTGDFDYILRVVAKDFVDYEDFLTNHLKTFSNIEQIKTHVIMKCNKDEKGVPIIYDI